MAEVFKKVIAGINHIKLKPDWKDKADYELSINLMGMFRKGKSVPYRSNILIKQKALYGNNEEMYGQIKKNDLMKLARSIFNSAKVLNTNGTKFKKKQGFDQKVD